MVNKPLVLLRSRARSLPTAAMAAWFRAPCTCCIMQEALTCFPVRTISWTTLLTNLAIISEELNLSNLGRRFKVRKPLISSVRSAKPAVFIL